MASQEDKKKLLDVRLNEGNSAHVLKTIRQDKEPSGQAETPLDTMVSLRQKLAQSPERVEMAEMPSDSPVSDVLEPEDTRSSEEASAENDEFNSENNGTDEIETEDMRSKPRRIFDSILVKLGGVIPKRGDPLLEIVRKCVFLVALITLIASLSYIFNDMVIIPAANESNNNRIAAKFDTDNPADPPADFTDYPEGIQPVMKYYYALNQDTRGWLKFSDTTGKWLNVNLPVLQSGDNEYYLTHDFQKAKNPNGSLFLDYRNNLTSASSSNKSLIVYGHDMGSGQMFGNFYHFVKSVNYARSAPVFDFYTLYQQSQYKVFAVMVINNNLNDGQRFDYLRTSFNGNKDFMDFVANIRARSMYDYNDVDVEPNDELLVLSTCSRESLVHFKDGRVVVVARKVRSGENVAVDTSNILTNDDVIMPEAWYKNQGMDDHPYYSGNFTIPGLWNNSSETTAAPDNNTTVTEQDTTTGETSANTTAKKTTNTTAGQIVSTTVSDGSGQEEETKATTGDSGGGEETKPEDTPPTTTTEKTTKETEQTTTTATAAAENPESLPDNQ